MRFKEYEFRQVEHGKWEIVKWFTAKEIPTCVTVMTMLWDKKQRDVNVIPIMERTLETYEVARFDRWLDICLKYITLMMGGVDE